MEPELNKVEKKHSLSHECGALESVELKNVKLREIIGTGVVSTVHEVDVLFPGSSQPTRCAAKRLRVGKDERLHYKRLEKVCMNLWRPGRHKIEHPNLVSFVGVWFSSRAELPQLVYEKMDTCLAKFLKIDREQSVLLSILRGVFCGLEFLHHFKTPLVHGELTANSIFINECSLVAKIGDLGVCEILGKGVCPSRSCSSYKSPESYKSDHVPQVADDLYASGVLIIHTLLQKYPESRSQPNDPEQLFSAYTEQFKEHPLHARIAACLRRPSERPPAGAILAAVEMATTATGVSSFDGACGYDEMTSSLRQAADQPQVQEKLKKKVKDNKPLTILITGKMGSGKSSLINGLVGKMVTIEGEELTAAVKHVSGHSFCVGDVQFLVVDLPGLQNLEQEDTETLDIIKRELTKVSNSFDLVIYCIDMTNKRADASERQAIVHLTECFSERIWENAVFTLTFANDVSRPPGYEGTLEEFFIKRIQDFKKILDDILIKADVSKKLVEDVPVIPAGYWKPVKSIPNPWQLPDRTDWFNAFWIVCAIRMEGSASTALFRSQAKRIRSKPLTETEKVGTAIERPIFVPKEYTPSDSIKIKVVGSLVAGSLVGPGIGTLLGIPGGQLVLAVVENNDLPAAASDGPSNTLSIDDLLDVKIALKNLTDWQSLSLALGLLYPTLKKIDEDQRGKTDKCVMEMLAAWLQQQDNVKQKGVPSWLVLGTALRKIGETQLADEIDPMLPSA